jgi:hypothetical protein
VRDKDKMDLRKLISASLCAGAALMANAAHLPKGTEVLLEFRQPLSSKTAKVGQRIHFTVKKDVDDPNGRVVLAEGTPVNGIVERVDKRSHFGANARIRIAIDPVHGVMLEPRDKGAVVGGTRGDEAAAASGGAALVFGPLGLVGGYFVVGHNVNIHAGDTLRTVVSDSR